MTTPVPPFAAHSAAQTITAPPPGDPLADAARAFEAVFLAQMLKSAGLGRAPDAFGGGAGEDQFSSFLVDEQAKALAARGGVGLAESIYRALRSRADG